MERKFKNDKNKSYQVYINVNSLHICVNFCIIKKIQMIQIRRKKQSFRNDIRKQYLDNHFKQIRNKMTKEMQNQKQQHTTVNQNIQMSQKQKLMRMMDQSSIVDELLHEKFFFEQLNQLVDMASFQDNKFEKKCLISIISNVFKDNLLAKQRQNLFRISYRMFQKFQLWNVDFQNVDDVNKFKSTLVDYGVEVFTFFIAEIIYSSQYLQQNDQQIIEKQFYPALANILLYSIHNPDIINQIHSFNADIKQSLKNIFNLHQQSYQTNNLSKAKRNIDFFVNIVKGHYYYIESKYCLPEQFEQIQKTLFILYEKIVSFGKQVKQFYSHKQFFDLVRMTFNLNPLKSNSIIFRSIISIFRVFVDNETLIGQINELILKSPQQTIESNGIWKIFCLIKQNSYAKGQALLLLKQILIVNCQNNSFPNINRYKEKLSQICIDILEGIQTKIIATEQNRFILNQALQIIYLMIKQENQKLSKYQPKFFNSFSNQSGFKRLDDISRILQQIDQYEEDNISEIKNLIDWIIMQNFYFKAQDTII